MRPRREGREPLSKRFKIMMGSTLLRMEIIDDHRVHVCGDWDDPPIRRSVQATMDLIKVPWRVERNGEEFTVILNQEAPYGHEQQDG